MRRRLTPAVLLVVLMSVIGACGGQPAEEAAEQTQEPAAQTAEPEPAVVSAEPEPEPQEPDQPQLVGNITLSGEDFTWGEITDPNRPAPYTWTVQVVNDTTQTLDITVRFEFLDENDRVVKAERQTLRLAPAQQRRIRENGSMPYDDANRVFTFQVDYDWAIVEGSA